MEKVGVPSFVIVPSIHLAGLTIIAEVSMATERAGRNRTYEEYANLRTVTRTQTNILLLLDDPKRRTGEMTNVVNVILDGTMEVYTQPPVVMRDGTVLLPWWIGDMPSTGRSRLGEIGMRGNPGLVTTGVIRQSVRDRPFPATLEAAVYQIFDVPGYGAIHNKFPVFIRGDVQEIPPFYTVAACREALLYDEQDNVVGMASGRSLTLLGPE
jgi:hypothetical protein